MSVFSRLVQSTVGRFLGRLRFPVLFSLTAAVFLIDVAVPDVVPFVDEILLALGSLVLGSLRKRRDERMDAGGRNDGDDGDDGDDGSALETPPETPPRPGP